MQLNLSTPAGEPLYECDRCQALGTRETLFFREDGSHECLSCWYEANRPRRFNPPAIIES